MLIRQLKFKRRCAAGPTFSQWPPSNVQVLSAPVRYWQHHERLASFLGKLLEIPGDRFSAPRLQENFATLYRFVQFSSCRTAQSMAPSRDQHTKGTEHEQAGGVRWRLQDGITFETCYEFHQYADPSQVESPGQILFLTGYLSPEYRVDSEFFNRFLDFRSINDRLCFFSVPPLPSSEWNLTKLSLFTISYDPQISTRTIREDTPNVLAEKHHRIQAGAKVPVGTTVIRNISVLDEMTLQLSNTSSYATSLPRSIEAGQFSYGQMVGAWQVPSLHFGYGRFLRQSLASGHPFIALTKVVTLVASSEKHFLNMMELKLERAVLNSGGKPYKGGLENLRYFNTVLNRQVRRIKSTLAALSNAGHRNKWLKADSEDRPGAKGAILESEKAIAQAGQMARLTFLAFIFVPMAFVSSFFSMNVPELQSVPLWAWFVASTVILTQASNVLPRVSAFHRPSIVDQPVVVAQSSAPQSAYNALW
ncbi:hypothetical protein NHJ6243_007810 [Beauveria neobassiana]